MKYCYNHATPNKPSITSNAPIHHSKKLDEMFVYTISRRSYNDFADFSISSYGHQITWPQRIVSRVSPAAIFHYVVNGKGTFNGEEVGAGKFLMTFPYQKYTILQNPDTPMEYYWITFLGPKTTELLKECKFNEYTQVYDLPYMDEIVAKFDEAVYGDHSNKDIDMYLAGFLYTLLAYHKKMNVSLRNEDITGSKDYNYFKKAMLFIDERVNEGTPVSVSDILTHLHISSSYCRMIFHKYSRNSPQQMILHKRFNKVKNDLELTSYSIKEIAYKAGYHDPSLFSRQFKKIFGVSPIEYRNNYRNTEVIE